jgi:uncharacterized protein
MPSTRKRYEAMLRNAGCDSAVIKHCCAVTRYALDLAGDNPLIDRKLLKTGAMLHDIGRGQTHSIVHAQAGADMCRNFKLPEQVARIIERHTGAGLTADECTLLGLLPRDCIPRTIEEQLVAHADNMINGIKRVTIHEALSSAIHLNRKIRNRIYHLSLNVEILCKN